ncbi:hypothetical protein [Myxococcus sp. Y35]|uniref:hypothetical protein n=1 Tax=Pseudomyxococcus flavus TaxID=3115648 RepID=UPI003CEFE7F3
MAVAGSALSACGVEDEQLAMAMEADAASASTTEQPLAALTFASVRAFNDGWVTDDAVNSTEHYNIGKIYWFLSGDSFYDAFMTFSFEALPPLTAPIEFARLRLCLQSVTGDPWGNLGPLYVARVDPYSSLNTSLYYSASFDTQTYWSGNPSTKCTQVDVTQMVRNGLAKGNRVYLRLFFPHAPRGGTQEFIRVSSSRDSQNYPYLYVKYNYTYE